VFRKLNLQNRILILVTSVTLVMMSVLVWFASYSLQRSVEETYVSQMDGMTTAINGRYEESHLTRDVQQIFDYIQYKNKNVVELTLYSKTKVEASTKRGRVGQPSPPQLQSDMTFNQTTLVDHGASEGRWREDRRH
jgi:two-component system NtrC family sensor kinase